MNTKLENRKSKYEILLESINTELETSNTKSENMKSIFESINTKINFLILKAIIEKRK